MMNLKKYEIILVFILLGIVVISLTDNITNIFDKSSKNSAEKQAKNLVETVEQMYTESIINGDDVTTFTAIFNKGEMYLKKGSPAKTSLYDGKIQINGKYPDSGEIVIYNDKVIANNTKIGNTYAIL